MTDQITVGASFRDPSGFVFRRDGEIFRQVNPVYRAHYDKLMDSGLYESLVTDGYLLPHAEIEGLPGSDDAYKILHPRQIPFVSHPYEWSFSQLQDAALATLTIQKRALASGMTLKDASAYNIQFIDGRPTLIDTLSFEHYLEGQAWVAYRQFCQHFLAPLAVSAYVDERLARASRTHLDGMPLDLASRLLPSRTRLKPGLLMHIHLHATSQRRFEGWAPQGRAPQKGHERKISRRGLEGIVESLESTVRGLRWKLGQSVWSDYYGSTGYSEAALDEKAKLVADLVRRAAPEIVWDLGANTGRFSRVAAGAASLVVSCDFDALAVERNYLETRERKERNILPLVLDLTNPSPDLGWAHDERQSLAARGPADLGLALALVHHLAIASNVPLDRIAQYFGRISRNLVIEFVPKDDPQVQRLLQSRRDVFTEYSREHFETAFAVMFELSETRPVGDSGRILYLMTGRRD